jgi:3-phosphoshikimate 1-carboxyvinyltransferase
MNYRIFPPDELIEATITLPLSKSMSNRALIISALTPGAHSPEEIAVCDDTAVMTAALDSDEPAVNVGAAGTAMRFLTAYFAALSGRKVTLGGNERMCHRPIGPLVDALRSCGASISYLGEEGFPPLEIEGRKLTGGELTVRADVSSQYISALLMVAPTMDRGLTVRLEGEASSLPYIDLTLGMMNRAGAEAERERETITVKPGSYAPVDWEIEADWSAATFWYEIEAITSGFVSLRGLCEDSLQPDRRVADIFSSLGVNTEFEGEEAGVTDLLASPELSPRLNIDLSDTPDAAQAIAVTCSMIGIPFRLSGLSSLKIKETDRLQAISTELEKVGVTLERIGDHTLVWDGRRHPIIELPVFDTYDDHRMAMALAPASVYLPGIVVRDIEVVSKSYPGYWDGLREAGFRLEDAGAGHAEETVENE